MLSLLSKSCFRVMIELFILFALVSLHVFGLSLHFLRFIYDLQNSDLLVENSLTDFYGIF
jgi:hypothetical protein